MSNTNIVVLFVAIAHASEKNESKKIKKIIKCILNKQIEKKKRCLIRNRCVLENEN